MKTIRDIRLFYSASGHENAEFGHKKLYATIHRVTMKLREQGFSLGDFDHLYVNFTASPVHNGMAPADRPVDRYHPWYRFYDVQISHERIQRLDEEGSIPELVSCVEALLIAFFSAEDFPQERIRQCVSCAVEQGENMLMHFREKVSANRKAVIYLRYSDQCRYVPVVKVFDADENLLLEENLSEMIVLDRLGEIQLSARKVTIKPRKNAFTEGMEPMTFHIAHEK